MGEKETAKAGWYPHPSMADTRRYWDGGKWTDHIAPATAFSGQKKIRARPLDWVALGTLLLAVAVGVGAAAGDFTTFLLLAVPGEVFLTIGVFAKAVQVGVDSSRL